MLDQATGRIKCLIGIHRRSRGQTVFSGDGRDTSVCRYCRAPMKVTSHGWILAEHSRD